MPKSKNRKDTVEFRVPALEIKQTSERVLYSFAIDGRNLHKIASVSRVHRDEDLSLGGYQRPEVLSHIAEIRKYLESADPLLPNAIVIAFDDRVRFIPSRARPLADSVGRHGTLVISTGNGKGDGI